MAELPQTIALPEAEIEDENAHARGWSVIVFNDDDHSFEYVITVFCKVLVIGAEDALRLALEIDSKGEAIVAGPMSKPEATSIAKALASYGPDPLMIEQTTSQAGLLAEIREA